MSETIAATRRLMALADACQQEADWLMAHHRAGHVGGSVFDPVSTLIGAGLHADRTAQIVVEYGDDNDLLRADVVSEEITRVLLRERVWRVALDEIHGVRREPSP